MPKETIVLVGCAHSKRAQPAPAQDLYASDWFAKARAYAEVVGSTWYILSAQHGLVEPQQVLAPYDRTLRQMCAERRRCWGRDVAIEVGRRVICPTRVVFLCGRLYRDPIIEFLEYMTWHPVEIEVPMEGMGIGRQKAWMAKQARTLREGQRGDRG